ncbi:MAG: hypothetical protein P8M05_03440 [Flavobacteriales bacterium]|nr:hypothetical protein [Flavobacteriales bacterium]
MGIFNTKPNKQAQNSGLTTIQGTVVKEGRYVPDFIHNMKYFSANPEVFEDGLIDC